MKWLLPILLLGAALCGCGTTDGGLKGSPPPAANAGHKKKKKAVAAAAAASTSTAAATSTSSSAGTAPITGGPTTQSVPVAPKKKTPGSP